MSVAELVPDIAEGFDVAREELIGAEAKLLLLRLDGGEKAYKIITTIDASWFAKFSEYFGTTTFSVANIEAEFGAMVRKSSHVTVTGSDLEALNNELFRIKPDTQPPLGSEPFWKIRAEATGDKYRPPPP